LLGLAVGSFALGCIQNTPAADNDNTPQVMLDANTPGDGDAKDAGKVDGGKHGKVEGSAIAHNCSSSTGPYMFSTACPPEHAPNPMPPFCDGYYCGTNYSDLRAESPTTAKCGKDFDLREICNGEVSHIMGCCGREAAIAAPSPDPGNAGFRKLVEECVAKSATIKDMSSGCKECYVDGVVCAKQNCLVACLPGDTPDCDACRATNKCTSNFYACGGIPDPF